MGRLRLGRLAALPVFGIVAACAESIPTSTGETMTPANQVTTTTDDTAVDAVTTQDAVDAAPTEVSTSPLPLDITPAELVPLDGAGSPEPASAGAQDELRPVGSLFVLAAGVTPSGEEVPILPGDPATMQRLVGPESDAARPHFEGLSPCNGYELGLELRSDSGTEVVDRGVATTGAIDANTRIGETIDHINDISSQIAAAVEEQSVTTSEIGDNIDQAASGTTAIASSAEDLAEVTRETLASAQTTQHSAENMAGPAQQLNHLVGHYN